VVAKFEVGFSGPFPLRLKRRRNEDGKGCRTRKVDRNRFRMSRCNTGSIANKDDTGCVAGQDDRQRRQGTPIFAGMTDEVPRMALNMDSLSGMYPRKTQDTLRMGKPGQGKPEVRTVPQGTGNSKDGRDDAGSNRTQGWCREHDNSWMA